MTVINYIKVEKKDKSKKKDNKDNKNNKKKSLFATNYDEFEVVSDGENDNSSFKTTTIKMKKENTKNILQKNKNEYLEILENNSFIFDIMLMTICGVTKIESTTKLNLISNDFYNRDLINYMIKYYSVDVASIDDEFHILDMLYNKNNKIDLLNIEINSLDIMSFDKIMEKIYKNKLLKNLKLSFFSADVSYFMVALLKHMN